MPGQFILIATNRLEKARRRERVEGLDESMEEKELQLIAFNEYVNEEGTEVRVVQVHRDAESMEFHMTAVAESTARAYAETLDGPPASSLTARPVTPFCRC